MHSKNTVRYYLLIAFFLTVLFFSNDFGLLDIQKTALIMAVGIDRTESSFVVTAQIAVPRESEQGQKESIQIESTGNTVADAVRQINAKTGWYPKLVFCNLILLGETAVKQNVFDALDFFISDEYMSDNCYVAACEGDAKTLLETKTPVDVISSVAMQKVLSEHAKKVGSVAPNTLREFSIGYFGDSKSSFLPILKIEPEKETGESAPPPPSVETAAESDKQTESTRQEPQEQEEFIFSAGETALFYEGKQVGKLDKEQTFAFCIAKNELRLTALPIEYEDKSYTIHIKRNEISNKVSIDENSLPKFTLEIKCLSGIWATDSSKAIEEITNLGNAPAPILRRAEETLSNRLTEVFQISRQTKSDIFEIAAKIEKHDKKYYAGYGENALDKTVFEPKVLFESLR